MLPTAIVEQARSRQKHRGGPNSRVRVPAWSERFLQTGHIDGLPKVLGVVRPSRRRNIGLRCRGQCRMTTCIKGRSSFVSYAATPYSPCIAAISIVASADPAQTRSSRVQRRDSRVGRETGSPVIPDKTWSSDNCRSVCTKILRSTRHGRFYVLS